MKTAEELIKTAFPDWHDWPEWALEGTIQVMQEYATAAVKDHLSRAAENARVLPPADGCFPHVDRESITNIDIQLP